MAPAMLLQVIRGLFDFSAFSASLREIILVAAQGRAKPSVAKKISETTLTDSR